MTLMMALLSTSAVKGLDEAPVPGSEKLPVKDTKDNTPAVVPRNP